MYARMCLCAVICIISITTEPALSRSLEDDLGFASLTTSYSEYLSSIEIGSDITDADAMNWITIFESALSEWSDPQHRIVAWEIIMSLHNLMKNWDESLFACESAIQEAENDGVLFNFQYDRWTILQRFDQEQLNYGRGRLSLLESGDVAASTFMKIFREDPQSKAVEDNALKFIALAWSMVRDQNYEKRLTLAREVVKVDQLEILTKSHGYTARQNHIGYLIGLLLQDNLIDESARYISMIHSEKGKLLAGTIALDTAKELGVSDQSTNQFLWAISAQF